MYDRSAADRINAQIAAEANARVINNRIEAHNRRVANTQEEQIRQHYELEIKRLQSDYRWQTKNVEAVEGTAGNSMAQTQTAIDIIMELTGKSFEEVRQMIYQNTPESKKDKIKKWLKTSPDFDGGLIHDARVILSK